MATCVVVEFAPACVDISGIRAGDLNRMQITLTLNGVPYDLTDAEVTSQARLKKSEATGIDAVIDIVDPVNGVITLRWPGDDVRELLAGAETWKGVWDLQVLNDGDPDPVTVIVGKFSAELDVTRVGV